MPLLLLELLAQPLQQGASLAAGQHGFQQAGHLRGAATFTIFHGALQLCAVLDSDPALAGHLLSGLPIRSTDELETVCREQHVELAVLCLPKEAAPVLVTRLLACGVRGFWNFSHYDIAHHHPGAISENVHLGDSLMTLSYQMQHHSGQHG